MTSPRTLIITSIGALLAALIGAYLVIQLGGPDSGWYGEQSALWILVLVAIPMFILAIATGVTALLLRRRNRH